MANETNHKRSLWMGVGEKIFYVLSLVIVAAYFSGGARARLQALGQDMENWKEEWRTEKEHITKMDLEGSVATKNFVTHYNQEQSKQYDRLKKLEEEVNHLESMNLRIDRLEKERNNTNERP